MYSDKLDTRAMTKCILGFDSRQNMINYVIENGNYYDILLLLTYPNNLSDAERKTVLNSRTKKEDLRLFINLMEKNSISHQEISKHMIKIMKEFTCNFSTSDFKTMSSLYETFTNDVSLELSKAILYDRYIVKQIIEDNLWHKFSPKHRKNIMDVMLKDAEHAYNYMLQPYVKNKDRAKAFEAVLNKPSQAIMALWDKVLTKEESQQVIAKLSTYSTYIKQLIRPAGYYHSRELTSCEMKYLAQCLLDNKDEIQKTDRLFQTFFTYGTITQDIKPMLETKIVELKLRNII